MVWLNDFLGVLQLSLQCPSHDLFDRKFLIAQVCNWRIACVTEQDLVLRHAVTAGTPDRTCQSRLRRAAGIPRRF